MENRVNDQPAYILHHRDYQGSSQIAELFTRDFGRLSLLIKGAKKRRDRAQFQPGYRLSVGWVGRSDLKTLTQAESHNLDLQGDAQMGLFYLNELLLYLLPKFDPHPRLFEVYQHALLHIRDMDLEGGLRNFEMDLLNELGLLPDLSRLSRNGSSLDTDKYYKPCPQQGVLFAQANEVGSYRADILLALQDRVFDTPDTLLAAKKILREFIDFNLQGRELQSRKVYQQLHKMRKGNAV